MSRPVLLGPMLGLSLSVAQERLSWLATSIMMYVITTNIAWATRHVKWTRAASHLSGLIRFAFYVGIPYLALLGGVVTLRSFGIYLPPLDERLVWAVPFAGGALILVAAIAWHYGKAVARLTYSPDQPSESSCNLLQRPWDWVLVLIRTIYLQVHWAFYRAVPVLILDDRYLGGFLGLALILVEAYANPRVRAGLTKPGEMELAFLDTSTAVISTVLYVMTDSLWPGAGTHLLLVMAWIILGPGKSSPKVGNP